ncbi:hypothetical protein I2I11_02625 [Pontibacter sp. 172403-2]|uniref:hypothetical protein n=1 Tax=Pontibacter rufus TaxID=2791028 RepID=UPI0018B00E0E|nr:hypothetical protein [Pontibacter sp. 172403-2]MBF9252178.1 hypothetical protein [Pontibacter sp. 172403-2]
MKNLQTSDPKEHARNVGSGLQELIDHLRKDIGQLEEPKAQALFETSAEVLGGLAKAFSDYEKGNEAAWK